jgi:PAS domain S-box-containing protein
MDRVPNCILTLSTDLLIVSIDNCFQKGSNIQESTFLGQKISGFIARLMPNLGYKKYQKYSKLEDFFTLNYSELDDERTKKAFTDEFAGISYDTIRKNNQIIYLEVNIADALMINTEVNLSRLKDSFHLMVESTDTLIILIDYYGNLEYHNPAWEYFMGQKVPSFERFRWEKFIHPDDIAVFNYRLYQAIDKKSKFSAELRILDQKAQYRWLKIDGIPNINDNGRFRGYICSGIEVPAIKRFPYYENEPQSLHS